MKFIVVLLLSIISASSYSQTLEYQTMARQWVKLSGHQFLDDHEFGKWFLKKHMYSTYQRVHNDEFELYDAIDDATVKGKAWLNKVSSDYIYDINTTTKLGKYDFKMESFPIEFSTDIFYYSEDHSDYLLNLPRRVAIRFNDVQEMESFSLNMSRKVAKDYIASKKDHLGNIDRKVGMRIKAKVASAKPVESINYQKYMILESDILALEIYDRKTNEVLGKII